MSVIQNKLFHVLAKFEDWCAAVSIDSKDITAICNTDEVKIAGFLMSKAHSILISEITFSILRIFFYLREGKSESLKGGYLQF